MKSLRGQLLTWLLSLLTIAGILGGLGAYAVGLREPGEEFDGQLRQLAIYIDAADAGSALENAARIREDAGIEAEDVISIQIWDRGGRVLRLSDPSVHIPRQGVTGLSDVRVEGDTWRVYTLVRPQRIVQVAQRTAIREDLATQSALRAVYPIAALIPLSLLLVGLIVSKILQPLDRLAADVAEREAGSGSPLPLAGLPSEIAPLVKAVNALLARQKTLLDFRQRFLSDTAHQLRTPLTASKLQIENLRHAASLPEACELSIEIERGLNRMSGMVKQLLDLARADAPDRPAPFEIHDLHDIIKEALEDVLVLADRRTVDIGMTTQATAPQAMASIVCDRHEARMLVGNLLDNAVRYTPPGGQVDIAIERSTASATLSVTDTGPGIPEADLGRLFDRFSRFGTADTEGSGLGLAIVQAIAKRHAAHLEVSNRHNRSGLLVSVQFPLAQPKTHASFVKR